MPLEREGGEERYQSSWERSKYHFLPSLPQNKWEEKGMFVLTEQLN